MKFIPYFILITLFLSYTIYDTSKNTPDGFLHIYILDVGQGDSTLIQTPKGKYILVDAGEDSYKLQTELQKIIPWFQKSIDILFITHPHEDHYYGFFDLEKRYTPNLTFFPPTHSSNSFKELLTNLNPISNMVISNIHTDLLLEKNILIDTLFPVSKESKYFKNTNNGSLVHKLIYKNFSMLLTGDAEHETIEYLLNLYPKTIFKSTVLKAAHHGSKTGFTNEFLKAVSPQITTISAGMNNKFNHPDQETINALQEIQTQIIGTKEKGTIEIITNGKWIEICYKKTKVCEQKKQIYIKPSNEV